VNKPFDFPILWRARRLGMRAQTVFRSGGSDFYPTDRRFAGAIDHWVSSSRYNARQIVERYERPVAVLHNGGAGDRLRRLPARPGWRASRGIPEGALLIASVGRLVGWKGLRVVIDALAELPGVHYLVMGEGAEEQSFRARAAELGVADRVHFAGRVARE